MWDYTVYCTELVIPEYIVNKTNIQHPGRKTHTIFGPNKLITSKKQYTDVLLIDKSHTAVAIRLKKTKGVVPIIHIQRGHGQNAIDKQQ